MKILYLSFTNTRYSSNATYINGLRACGAEVVAYFPPAQNWRKYIQLAKFYRQNRQKVDFIIVGNDCPKLVIWMKIISRRPIVYNALCSVYERLIVSRGLAGRYSLKAFYYWLLDFFASHFSRLVMLESVHQIEYFCRRFFLDRSKTFLAWTGVDEEHIFFEAQTKKNQAFTAVFRGRLLPEAGAEVAVRAAKLLEHSGIKMEMYASGFELSKLQALVGELRPANLRLVADFLPVDELRRRMQVAHLSLGQLSAHPRLERTVPHKAFESLALKVPYLTARNPAVMEILREGETCLAFKPGDARDLAEKILWGKTHPGELQKIAEAGYNLYLEKFTAKKLAGNLIEALRKAT